MTTQKEFHELLHEIENLSEKHKDFTYYYYGSEEGEYIRKSIALIPIAIDRIKRLERAVEMAQKYIKQEWEDYDSIIAEEVLKRIEKELGE